MSLTIVPLYAACLVLMFFVLSLRVIRIRRRIRIPLGTRRHPGLLRASRAHANFAAYVPLAAILLGFVEAEFPPLLLHALGLARIAGRVCLPMGSAANRKTSVSESRVRL